MTLDCLFSLQKYGGDLEEIILISNNSLEDELTAVREGASKFSNTKVLVYNYPFNYQKINNWGVDQSSGKAVLLLNNDIELTSNSKGLIEKMYQASLEPKNGAIGCVLLYEDSKSIQHAGVYLVPGGTADHLYAHKNLNTVEREIKDGKLAYDVHTDLRVSAVTAAAVVVERKKYLSIKGLNENFIICGGDVDLCLRLADKGYKTLLIGSDSGYMLHKESKSRSMIAVPYVDFVESYKIYIKHFDLQNGDPYLHWKKVKNV